MDLARQKLGPRPEGLDLLRQLLEPSATRGFRHQIHPISAVETSMPRSSQQVGRVCRLYSKC